MCTLKDEMEGFSDDDIPPLEDMSGFLEQAKEIQRQKERPPFSVHQTPSLGDTAKMAPDGPSQDGANGSAVPKMKTSTAKAETAKPKEVAHTSKPAPPSAAGFGGLKKGFLFSGPSRKSAPTGAATAAPVKPTRKACAVPDLAGGADIPLIRPKVGAGDQGEQHRIQEVQDALASTAPMLQNKDWVDDNLLSRLSEHPRLAGQVSNPRFARAVQQFQANPQQAMQEYRDDAEVQQFFKDFCALLGSHFNSMGGTSTTPAAAAQATPSGGNAIRTRPSADPGADLKARSSSDPGRPTAAEEARMQQILADPSIREVLADPLIQELMETLRANPDQGQRILQSAEPSLRAKVHKLVEAGLLGFA